MNIYKIPFKYRTGKFKFSELNISELDEGLELEYYTEYQILDYDVPMYKNEKQLYQVSIYMVPIDQIPNGLTAVYGGSGELDKVELVEAERTRLIYIRFKNIKESKKAVLKFVKNQADKMSAEVIGRKQKLARLFFGTYYDGTAIQIAVITGTPEDMKAIIDKNHGKRDIVDNSGEYPLEKNMIELDDEPLGVMLLCTDRDFKNILFNLTVETVKERIKRHLLKKINKTDDFKFILEEWD